MLGNDTHAPGSVDWVLWERLIRLCTETAGYLYKEYTPTQVRYEKGSRPTLESYLKESVGDCGSDEDKIKGIVRFTQRLGQNVVDESLDEMRFGGTEEEIIQRGSDWCTDVARVGCVLSQVAGIPARLINLFNTNQAYSGHVITEVYRGGVWGAVDPTTAVIYRKPNGIPASTWELMNQPQLIEVSSRGESTPYTTEGQFRAAGVSIKFAAIQCEVKNVRWPFIQLLGTVLFVGRKHEACAVWRPLAEPRLHGLIFVDDPIRLAMSHRSTQNSFGTPRISRTNRRSQGLTHTWGISRFLGFWITCSPSDRRLSSIPWNHPNIQTPPSPAAVFHGSTSSYNPEIMEPHRHFSDTAFVILHQRRLTEGVEPEIHLLTRPKFHVSKFDRRPGKGMTFRLWCTPLWETPDDGDQDDVRDTRPPWESR